MRIVMTTSGILGIILLVVGFVGTIIDFLYNHQLFIGSIILIVGITLPIWIIDRVRYNQKISKIIKTYKGSQNKKQKILETRSEIKGWSMNNSPFRERKSGVTWGGGNIKGANATRGTRKSFLK